MVHSTDTSTGRSEADGPPTAETFDTHPFAEASLDALPTQVAILNEEGEIVYTNQAWQQFARENGIGGSPAMLGDNYLAACDRSSGDDAAAAARGIRSVLRGDCSQFSLEYTCHGSDERRWFIMRTIRFCHEGNRFALTLHLNITERKLSELALERQNTQLRTVNRINVLIREVIQSLLEVETRDELEDIVCSRLTESEFYEAAWVASSDAEGREFSVRSQGTTDDEFLGSVEALSASERTDTGVRTALNGRRPEVVRATRDAAGPIQSLALDHGYLSYVAVPITYRDARYGVLVVHTAKQEVFSEWERAAFKVLGETLGHASNAIENRRLLFADFVTELEFEVSDPDSFLTTLSTRTDCEVELTGFVPLTSDAIIQYATVEGTDAATVEAVGETVDTVENTTVISEYDGGVRLEYTVSGTSLVSLLAEYGVNVRTATATGGDVRVVAEAVSDADLREIVNAIRTEFTEAELAAKREVERSTRTLDEYWETVTDRLTDRQLSMLQAAYHAGFFEWPRESSGEEVAASFGLSAATFHEHTRVGLEKMLTLLFQHDK